jgi:Flp pilus assembly protein TadG
MEGPVKMQQKSLLNEKGQVLIFVTLAFAILGMFVGLAIDGGRAYLMRERLRSIVDAAALAGAKAMAGSGELSQVLSSAVTAACDSAKVNGLASGDGECGGSGTKLNVSIGDVTNPDGSTQQGIIVTGTDTARTFFMALGALIGCDSCKTINVAHTGKAAPDTLADIVIVLDDTGTMSALPSGNPCVTFNEPDCPINGAKQGAITLVNKLLSDQNSHAMIAFVPFRGCYAFTRNLPPALGPDPTGRQGCITPSDVQNLTNDSAALTAHINTRFGAGGYPGTNVCLAMHEGRKQLFGPASRPLARKIMVLLTDGDQSYSDYAWGGLGSPQTPWPYPTSVYTYSSGVPNSGTQSGWNAGGEPDAAQSVPGGCMSAAPGDPAFPPPGDPAFQPGFPSVPSRYNSAINSLDSLASAKATTLKQASPRGTNIEIYVLRFSAPSDDTLTSGDPPGACDPSLIGLPGPNRGGPPDLPSPDATSDDIRDRNLSRCLASNTAMGDPLAARPNDHYFDAPNVAAIKDQFAEIASNILRKRRLVS